MRFFLLLLVFIPFSQASGAVKLSREWARSTLQSPHYQFRYFNRMPPILTSDLVIQGNAVDGIKAFDRETGHAKWQLAFKNGVEGGAVTDGNKLFFGANNGQFYSVNAATGDILWTYPLNSESLTQPLVEGNIVFHITGNNTVYAFNKDSGQCLWIKTNSIKSTMTLRGQTAPVYDKGIVYIGFSDGNFAAFNSQNGRELWSKRLGDDKKFTDVDATAYITDRCVLVASYANSLYCLDKQSGDILWRHDVGAFNAAIVDDGKIYYPTAAGEIHILDASSGKQLKKIVDIKGLSTELLVMGEWLVYGESNGSVVLRDKNSLEIKDRFNPGRGIFATPTVDPKKKEIYFISNEANIFKLKVAYKDLTNTFPWDLKK